MEMRRHKAQDKVWHSVNDITLVRNDRESKVYT